MLNQFSECLRICGKFTNTAAAYCRDVGLYFKWCEATFGQQPSQLYRANVLEYISFLRNVKGYNPRTINRHLSALRNLNEWLVESGQQVEAAVLPRDFMKIQVQYASPCTVTKKDVEAFRQRLLEGGSKRDYAIVTLYAYSGVRRSE